MHHVLLLMAYQPSIPSSTSGFQSPFGDTTFTRVFVGGLAWETQSGTMRPYFEQFGEILEAVVITNKNVGRSKGYGFVTFRDPESASNHVWIYLQSSMGGGQIVIWLHLDGLVQLCLLAWNVWSRICLSTGRLQRIFGSTVSSDDVSLQSNGPIWTWWLYSFSGLWIADQFISNRCSRTAICDFRPSIFGHPRWWWWWWFLPKCRMKV